MRPKGLLGIHLNTQYAFPAQIPGHAVTRRALRRRHPRPLHRLSRWIKPPSGYEARNRRIRSGDSPAGQAAWIYEKFQSKTDNHGSPRTRSVPMTCSTQSRFIGSQTVPRPPAASTGEQFGHLSWPKAHTAVAVTVFPRDIPRLPRSWIEDTYTKLIHYGEADKGGHFAAFEQPRS